MRGPPGPKMSATAGASAYPNPAPAGVRVDRPVIRQATHLVSRLEHLVHRRPRRPRTETPADLTLHLVLAPLRTELTGPLLVPADALWIVKQLPSSSEEKASLEEKKSNNNNGTLLGANELIRRRSIIYHNPLPPVTKLLN